MGLAKKGGKWKERKELDRLITTKIGLGIAVHILGRIGMVM